MKLLVGRIIALILLVVVIAIGGITIHSADSSGEVSRITNYRAEFTVDADGELRATEIITVNFPTFRHGIFRFFDTRDPNHSENRLIP